MKWKKCIIIFITGFLLCGCGVSDKISLDTGIISGTQDETADAVTEFTYEVPKSTPNVLVDQVGYQTDSVKTAVFRGKNLSDTFQIINAVTGETVYTGTIGKSISQPVFGEYCAMGTFTDLTTPGTYYIQTAYIGQSYQFKIGDNLYKNILNEACLNLYSKRCGINLDPAIAGTAAHQACHLDYVKSSENPEEVYELSGGWHNDDNYGKDVSEACEVIAPLLLSYELYPAVFDDATGIPESGNNIPDILDEVRYEVDWLLKMQDAKTGGVYEGVTQVKDSAFSLKTSKDDETGEDNGTISPDQDESEYELLPVSLEATEEFIAILSKFAYSYKNYDTQFASQCLTAAEKAWKSIDARNLKNTEDEYFFAAAELYRSIGRSTYRNEVTQYLEREDLATVTTNHRYYGTLTYFMTKFHVDVDVCTKQMKLIMNEGEEIASSANDNRYGICLTKGYALDNIVSAAAKLTVVEHVITNHEYAMVIESHLHYFLGENTDGVSYVRNYGTKMSDGIYMDKTSLRNAEFILVLSEVINAASQDSKSVTDLIE